MSATVLSPTVEVVDVPTCFYINASDRLQMVRLTEFAKIEFERVLFPGQRLMFEARPDAVFEVYSDSCEGDCHQSFTCSELACL
ncbi:MAG: DUF1830 domain-containing protein [Synechococcus sp.]